MRPYVGSWKRLAVQGAAAVFFGLATLVWPSITLWSLVLLWGAFASRRRHHRARRAAIADPLLVHRGWVAFWGVTGIGAGLVTFLWPSITALALLVVIATWALLIGGSRIAFAISAQAGVGRVVHRRSVVSCWCCSGCSSSSAPVTERSASPGRSGGSPSCSAASSCRLRRSSAHETHELTRQTTPRVSQPATRPS